MISVLSFQTLQHLEKHGKNLPKIISAGRVLNFSGVIEHQGRSPWNYHVHAIGVWDEELSDKAIAEIKAEWRRMGGSSGKIDKPWEDDPYRKVKIHFKAKLWQQR